MKRGIWALILGAILLGLTSTMVALGLEHSRINVGCGSTQVHDSPQIERSELQAMEIPLSRGLSAPELSKWNSVGIAGRTALVRRQGTFALPNEGETQALMALWKGVYRNFHPADTNPMVSIIILRKNGEEGDRILSEQCPVWP